jgi:acyl carrier protein
VEENIIFKIELLQLVEAKYSIQFADEEVENLITIQDLIDLVKKRLNKNGL